jgi:hypothetical protein
LGRYIEQSEVALGRQKGRRDRTITAANIENIVVTSALNDPADGFRSETNIQLSSIQVILAMIEQVAHSLDPVGLGPLDTVFICYHGIPSIFQIRHASNQA